MPFEQTILPQYRDADPDGLIGLKGCMHYFQDIHTYYMHSIHKGNDELPEQYGAAWVYTRYHVSLKHKLDYTDSAQLSTWMEPYHRPVLVNLNFILRPLFGFSTSNGIGVPITALGAAGAALGLTSDMAHHAMLRGNDVAVFTAMCMCWSGYLSTHTSMMDSLHCKELTGKAILSHTIGGLAAGIAAHWIYQLFALIWG